MGVDVEDGEQALLADTADDFVAATLRLLGDPGPDPAARRGRAAAGRGALRVDGARRPAPRAARRRGRPRLGASARGPRLSCPGRCVGFPLSLAVVLVIARRRTASPGACSLPPFQGQDEILARRLHPAPGSRRGEVPWTAVHRHTTEETGPRTRREVRQAEKYYTGERADGAERARRPLATEVDEGRGRGVASSSATREVRTAANVRAPQPAPLLPLHVAVYPPLSGSTSSPASSPCAGRRCRCSSHALVLRVAAGRRALRPAALAADGHGARAALHPMLAQLGGVVNPDAMIAAVWGLGLWLSAVDRQPRAHPRPRRRSGAASVAAFFIHPRRGPGGLRVRAARSLAAAPRARPRRGAAPRRVAVAGAARCSARRHVVRAARRGERRGAGVRLVPLAVLPAAPGLHEAEGHVGLGRPRVFVDRLGPGSSQLEIGLPPGSSTPSWCHPGRLLLTSWRRSSRGGPPSGRTGAHGLFAARSSSRCSRCTPRRGASCRSPATRSSPAAT